MKPSLADKNKAGLKSTLLAETVKMDGSLASAFTCPVCLGFYKDPVMLSCGHAFCLSCEKNNHTAIGKKTCPECRVEYTSTKEMNPIIPLRKALASLPDEDATFPVGKTCIHVGNYTDTAKNCPHCDKPFCASCMVCHLERVRIEMKWVYDSFKQRQDRSGNGLQEAIQKAKNAITSGMNDARSRVKQEAVQNIQQIKQKEHEWLAKIDSQEEQEMAAVDSFFENRTQEDIKVVEDRFNAISGTSLLFHSAEHIKDLNRAILDLDHKIYAKEYLEWHSNHFEFEVDYNSLTFVENQKVEIDFSTNVFPSVAADQYTEPLRLGHAVGEGGLEEVKEFFERPQLVPLIALRQIVDFESISRDEVAVVVAAKQGKTDTVRYLVEKCGADVLRKDGTFTGDMAIHAAARFDHVDTVRYLVKRDKTSVKALNNQRIDAFQIAIESGSFKVVKYFVEKGFIKVEGRNRNGYTPLMLAVEEDDVTIVKYLIEDARADPMIVNQADGNNLMHIGIRNNSTNVLKYLATSFPELATKKDLKGYSPIFDACLAGFLDGFNILAEGNNEYVKKHMSSYLLHNAATSGNVELGRVLIEKYGATVDVVNKSSGKGAIHFATEKNLVDFVALLLKANPAVKNLRSTKRNETPLEIATRLGFEEIKKLMQDGI